MLKTDKKCLKTNRTLLCTGIYVYMCMHNMKPINKKLWTVEPIQQSRMSVENRTLLCIDIYEHAQYEYH